MSKPKCSKLGYILFAIISVLLIIGVVYAVKFKNVRRFFESDSKRFVREYHEVGEDNVFVYKNIDEIINILEKGTGVVYLGFPECPWCQAYVKYLNEVAKESGLKEVYYFDIREDRKNNSEKYRKIVSLLEGNLLYDDNGKARVYVPDVTAVVEGSIIGHNNETSVIEGSTPASYWTDERVDNLKGVLREMVKRVMESGKCTSCNG